MPNGVPNKRYTLEFKARIVGTMRKEGLSYCEVTRQFEVPSDTRIESWKRIYLTEGAEVQVERRGRGSKGRPAAMPLKQEEDLLGEYGPI